MRSARRHRRACGTVLFCSCSPRPDCAIKSCGRWSFGISTGVRAKCSCVEPRRGAIASCRSYRTPARRLPSMSCMPDLRATVGASSYSISRPCAPSTRALSFPGSCDRHWSEAGSSFLAIRSVMSCSLVPLRIARKLDPASLQCRSHDPGNDSALVDGAHQRAGYAAGRRADCRS